MSEQETTLPPQTQSQQPGHEDKMTPRLASDDVHYLGSGKLENGWRLRHWPRDRRDVRERRRRCRDQLSDEHKDAEETRRMVEEHKRKCITIPGDIGDEQFCQQLVEQTVRELGKLDILVNNAAEQHPQDSIEKISAQQLKRTFRTNIFAMFFLTKAALKHLKKGSVIVNTTPSRLTTDPPSCSTTPRQKVRLSPSRVLFRSRSQRRGFA